MDRRFYRGVELPPQAPAVEDDPRPKLKVWRPRDSRAVLAVLLSPSLYAYWTHYDQTVGHPVPCWGNALVCPGCHCKLSKRKKWFGAGLDTNRVVVGLVELTAGAVEYCPQLTEPGRNLRGQEVKVWRMRSGRSAPERAALLGRAGSVHLPEEPDVPLALARVWGLPLKAERVEPERHP